MKKIAILLMGLLLWGTLAGCGAKDSPEKPVKDYFAAVKTLNVEAMGKTVAPANRGEGELPTDLFSEDTDDFSRYFEDYLKANAKKTTYVIQKSQGEGDRAVVTVKAKYIDGGPLFGEIFAEAFIKLLGIAFSGSEPSEEEIQGIFGEILTEKTKTVKDTYKEVVMEIPCVRVDGVWYLEEMTPDLVDVAVSGFLSATEAFSESFQ